MSWDCKSGHNSSSGNKALYFHLKNNWLWLLLVYSLYKTSVKGKENRFSLLFECSSMWKLSEKRKIPLLLALKKWLRRCCGKELKQLDVNLHLTDKWGNREMRLCWWTQEWTHTSKLVSCYVDNITFLKKITAVIQVSGRTYEAYQPSFHIANADISPFPALLIFNKCHGYSCRYKCSESK